jgi:hypothetical protein
MSPTNTAYCFNLYAGVYMIFGKVKAIVKKFNKERKVKNSLYLKHTTISDASDFRPYVFCLVRNGTFFADEFIKHYRQLGFGNIYFIDNNSTDDLVTSVKKYSNICVLGCDLPFLQYESEMRRVALKEYGMNKWCLCVDIDEFADFPFLDKISLKAVIEYLDINKYNCVLFHMLDMYSDSISDNFFKSSTFNRKKYTYCSPQDIQKKEYRTVHFNWYMRNNVLDSSQHFFFGGCRKRLFGTDNWLTKHALMFIDKHIEPFVHPHISNKLKLADISGILYHYHFADGFLDKVKGYVESKNVMHTEHQKYLEVINNLGQFSFVDKDSIQLKNCDQLLENNLLDISDKFLDYVSNITNTN